LFNRIKVLSKFIYIVPIIINTLEIINKKFQLSLKNFLYSLIFDNDAITNKIDAINGADTNKKIPILNKNNLLKVLVIKNDFIFIFPKKDFKNF